MQWKWKAERFPLGRGQIEVVRNQLSNELFDPEDEGRVPKEEQASSSSDEEDDESDSGAVKNRVGAFEKKR